eukprot:1408852-Rhodomonas_salina.1
MCIRDRAVPGKETVRFLSEGASSALQKAKNDVKKTFHRAGRYRYPSAMSVDDIEELKNGVRESNLENHVKRRELNRLSALKSRRERASYTDAVHDQYMESQRMLASASEINVRLMDAAVRLSR